MTERRKFMRFNAILDVIYRAIDNSPQKIKSMVKDLSKEGARLHGNKLEKGALLELEMKVPGDNIPIFAFGEVAWSQKSGGAQYESGIRFTKIESHDRAKLLDYVYNEWIRSKKEKREF